MKKLEIDLDLCFECLAPAEHLHHVVPEVLGGTKTVPLCRGCHGKIHDLPSLGSGELVNQGQQQARAEGANIGVLPFGLRYTDRLDLRGRRIVEEHPDEKAALDAIMSLVDAGLDDATIASAANAAGYRTRKGLPWSKDTIRKLRTR